MIVPAAPPITAPMMAPLAVEPDWWPITPPAAPPAVAPMIAPLVVLLSDAQPAVLASAITVANIQHSGSGRRLFISSSVAMDSGLGKRPAAPQGALEDAVEPVDVVAELQASLSSTQAVQ